MFSDLNSDDHPTLYNASVSDSIHRLITFNQDHEDRELNEQTRVALKSKDLRKFIRLEDGVTHYELSGPENGPVVVLIHGVSGPMIVWDKTNEALTNGGFRVLRLDLYGRGFSDRVKGPYNLNLFVRQIKNLIDALQVSTPLTLVGSSMGAIITSELARRYPKLVRRVALVGPAGFPLQASPLAKLITVPFLGDYLMNLTGDKTLAEHNRKYFYHPDQFKTFQERFESQLRFKGSKKAILSTFRSVPLQQYLSGYEALGREGRHILLIWGIEDHAFPYSNHTKAIAALKDVEFVSVPEAGHLPQYEQPDITNEALLKFLSN